VPIGTQKEFGQAVRLSFSDAAIYAGNFASWSGGVSLAFSAIENFCGCNLFG